MDATAKRINRIRLELYQRGWSFAELSRRSGLPIWKLQRSLGSRIRPLRDDEAEVLERVLEIAPASEAPPENADHAERRDDSAGTAGQVAR
jgi:ribosome-binding protein aMBF1 (putative translation factor)